MFLFLDCHRLADDRISPNQQNSSTCLLEPALDRYQEPDSFSTVFIRLFNDTIRRTDVTLNSSMVSVLPFRLESSADIGGTLKVMAGFKKKDMVIMMFIFRS